MRECRACRLYFSQVESRASETRALVAAPRDRQFFFRVFLVVGEVSCILKTFTVNRLK